MRHFVRSGALFRVFYEAEIHERLRCKIPIVPLGRIFTYTIPDFSGDEGHSNFEECAQICQQDTYLNVATKAALTFVIFYMQSLINYAIIICHFIRNHD